MATALVMTSDRKPLASPDFRASNCLLCRCGEAIRAANCAPSASYPIPFRHHMQLLQSTWPEGAGAHAWRRVSLAQCCL